MKQEFIGAKAQKYNNEYYFSYDVTDFDFKHPESSTLGLQITPKNRDEQSNEFSESGRDITTFNIQPERKLKKMSQQKNQDIEEYNFIREFGQKHCYNLGIYDFAPFWTTVKQIQQTLQQVCGTKRQSAHISLNLTDIVFNGCKENRKEVNDRYYDQLAYSTIDFTESDATYFDPFWLEKEYYHYIMKQPRVSVKEHANQFYGDVFKYAALKTYINFTDPFTKHSNPHHNNPMLKAISNIELAQNVNLKNYTVHLQIDFDLDIWKDVTE